MYNVFPIVHLLFSITFWILFLGVIHCDMWALGIFLTGTICLVTLLYHIESIQ